MSEALKACPFCGGDAEPIECSDASWYVMCAAGKCGGQTPYGKTKPEAIERWNTRAQLPSQGGEAVATDAFVPGSLADLLFQLGEKGIGVSGGTHGDHWRVSPLYTHPADQVAQPDAELVRQCIAQELATWEGDFKGPVHTAMRCLQVRIDAKLASLK